MLTTEISPTAIGNYRLTNHGHVISQVGFSARDFNYNLYDQCFKRYVTVIADVHTIIIYAS